MSRNTKILLLTLAVYVSLAFVTVFIVAKPAFYGLSTVLGTTILSTVLGTTVLGTTVLGSTLLGTTSLVQVYTEAMALGQLAISLSGIGMLIYLELSDPSYGKTRKLVKELRKSWLPLASTLIVLFSIVIFFKIRAILA